MRSTANCTALAAMLFITPIAPGQVGEGDLAPLHRPIDDKMRVIDMADFIDGGRVLAYASTVENRTGDPVFQTAWTRD
jgi:hypothetical protein